MAKADESDKTDYGACVLGLADYVNKNGFRKVILGVSGDPKADLSRSAKGRVVAFSPSLELALLKLDGLPGPFPVLELDDSELTKAIIGTIGDLDSYLLPDAKGWTALTRRLLAYDDTRRQQFRNEVLATTPADFNAFGAPLKSGGSTIRRVISTDWMQEPESLRFEIVANAFLYHMVRRVVFMQVMVAQGMLPLAEIKLALHAESNPGEPAESVVKPTSRLVHGLAPAHGLVLAEVHYPPEAIHWDEDNQFTNEYVTVD